MTEQTTSLSLSLTDLDAGAALDHAAPRPFAAPDLQPIASWARRAGAVALQLDARVPGLRPRDLDRSARREVAAILRRAELAISGVDLLIPNTHWSDPAHIQRAVDAAHEASQLAADLQRLVISHGTAQTHSRGIEHGLHLALRLGPAARSDVLEALSSSAQRTGIRIAETHRPPAPLASDTHQSEVALALLPSDAESMIDSKHVTIGTASLVSTDPVDRPSMPMPPVSARWPTQAAPEDAKPFRLLLASIGYHAPVVVDLAEAGNPALALQKAVAAFSRPLF